MGPEAINGESIHNEHWSDSWKPMGRWTPWGQTLRFWAKTILYTNEDRAIDLSCRACGAGAMCAVLVFPVGASAPLLLTPPTSDTEGGSGEH